MSDTGDAFIDQDLMQQWDEIRAEISKGDDGSYPRDWFESVIDGYEAEIERLRQAGPLFIAAMEMCGISEAAQGAVMACWRTKVDDATRAPDDTDTRG